MNLEVKGTHGYSPDASIREYIDKKLKRLSHVENHMADLHLTLDREKNGEFKTEANLHFRWGAMGHIKVTDRNLFKALDFLFDKIEVKATKEKDKMQEH